LIIISYIYSFESLKSKSQKLNNKGNLLNAINYDITKIKKPKTDNRELKAITLNNGVKVLYILDENSTET